MEFKKVLEIVAAEPVFETGLLLAGEVDPRDVRRQLSRWKKSGQIYQMRRGLYALAPPYQKIKAHPFLIANRLVRHSYVSCQSALAHHGLIPEYVPVVTSVTTGRPYRFTTPLGNFEYHYIKARLFRDCRFVEVAEGQNALLAKPEKALLDLVHLQPGGDSPDYLGELRLQNLERLDLGELLRQAKASKSPKLERAATWILKMARAGSLEYETL